MKKLKECSCEELDSWFLKVQVQIFHHSLRDPINLNKTKIQMEMYPNWNHPRGGQYLTLEKHCWRNLRETNVKMVLELKSFKTENTSWKSNPLIKNWKMLICQIYKNKLYARSPFYQFPSKNLGYNKIFKLIPNHI